MKRKFILVFIIATIFGIFVDKLLFNNKTEDLSTNINAKINREIIDNRLSMMLETDANSKKYETTYQNEWPTSEYKFNSMLSKCENGGSLSWDYKTSNVIMEGTTSDKCYIYFDKVVTVSDYCTSGDNLADCIKMFGNQGYDKSNIYIHDGSLKYGASDNSYRFAGSSDYVNNYVCFGSNEEVCPSDNLYRIIGVFDGQVKLIKADFANSNLLGTDGGYNKKVFVASKYSDYKGNLTNIETYNWMSSTKSSNIWSESDLNIINLNTNYLNNLEESWANIIDDATWQVGGNTWKNIGTSPMYEVYQNEIVKPNESNFYSAQIGLMYVSDYGYAASQKYWIYVGYDENGSWDTDITLWSGNDYSKSINENWMYSGVFEWVITRRTDLSSFTFTLYNSGCIFNSYTYSYGINNSVNAVRPCFYLKSSIKYAGGSGTKESPIILEF